MALCICSADHSADLYPDPVDGGVFLQCLQADFRVGGLFPEMVPGVVPGQRSGEALINNLILAVLSCAFAVLIGTSGALGMSRRKRKLDDAVAYVSTLPIMIPEIILGMVFFVRIFPDGTALWYGHTGDRPYHVLCALRVHYGTGETGGNEPVSGRGGVGSGSYEVAGI